MNELLIGIMIGLVIGLFIHLYLTRYNKPSGRIVIDEIEGSARVELIEPLYSVYQKKQVVFDVNVIQDDICNPRD